MTGYKMLATDLDDSLLDDGLRIANVDRVAIFRAIGAGVKIVLATGRMFRSTLPYARELGLDTPLITYEGAYVKADGAPALLSLPVPYGTALEVVERVMREGYHINIYIDDQVLVAKKTEESRICQAISGVEPLEVGNLADYLRAVGREPTKILVVTEEEFKLDWVSAGLKEQFKESLYITKSKPFFLEIMNPGTGKGAALAAVAGYYGIDRENIVAVGDSYNDLDMIEYAGLGVAMANAREEIKMRAGFVTNSNNCGGVARVISKFIFNEEV